MSDIQYQPVTPEGWSRPRGYSHAVSAKGTTHIRIAGQVGNVPGQAVEPAADFGTQWTLAMSNLVTVLRAAGAQPEHLIMLRAYVADIEDFRKNGAAVASAWSETLGKHFPAMTLVQISGFLDPHATVEIEAEALLP